MEQHPDDRVNAWYSVFDLLQELAPQLMDIPGTGEERALRAIRVLAGVDPDIETTAEAIALLRAGDAKGRAKYPTTLDDAELSPVELVRHATEEAADLLKYLVAARRALVGAALSPAPEALRSTPEGTVPLPAEATDAMVKAVEGIIGAHGARRLWSRMAEVYLFRPAT